MKRGWNDAAHLIRPALVFTAGLVLFLLVRKVVVPPSFGAFGHYRAAVLNEIRLKPVNYAGHGVCGDCHPDELAVHDKGTHKGISCEACHGPLAAHVADSAAVKPVKPEPRPLCVRCHEADSAKPAWFKQVVAKEHAGDEPCQSCHQPHSPKL